LQWLDATDDILAESRAFLFDHGYERINIRAYTSKTRDAARAKLGLAPFKGSPSGGVGGRQEVRLFGVVGEIVVSEGGGGVSRVVHGRSPVDPSGELVGGLWGGYRPGG